ncbi:unnamed protein product [Boreogadus saida]
MPSPSQIGEGILPPAGPNVLAVPCAFARLILSEGREGGCFDTCCQAARLELLIMHGTPCSLKSIFSCVLLEGVLLEGVLLEGVLLEGVLLEGVLLEGVFLDRPFVQLSRSGG